ncbi:MAG: nuclear transport factor 2 family protein [Acidimicrobiales bacterium]
MTMSYEDRRTLQAMAGRAAVQDLTIRQHRALETGDLTTWIGTFVVAGVLELPGHDPICGHADLQKWFASAPRPAAVHLVDSVVRIDGVRGNQESRALVSNAASPDGLHWEKSIPMVDDLIYERGRWYFARRRVGTLAD